jgi:haloacetate dehalogenase
VDSLDAYFEGFESASVALSETTVFYRRKGSGPPLLLLHGFPQTHLMWHVVAPMLAGRFTLVCADLRGYGASGKPESAPDHAPYSKAAMARDLVELMASMGFSRFSVAGHDRGGRVAYRMALDHPERVERIALLDIIPTGEALARADFRLALGYWPWSLLSQPEPLPERLLTAEPAAIVDDALTNWGSEPTSFPVAIHTAYVEALRDPQTAHAICEEFRAAATFDREADQRDMQAGRKIHCPVLVLWAAGGPLDTWYIDAGGPLGVWRQWAPQVRGKALAGGHFFPEQNAEETAAEMLAFFAAP